MDDKNSEKTGSQPKDEVVFRTRREQRREQRELRRRNKSQRPSTSFLFWGLMLVLWGILIFLLEQHDLTGDDLWKAFIIGLGAIFLIQSFANYLVPSGRPYAMGRFIPGIILIFVGLGFLFGFNAWWPLALGAAGLAVLLISLFLQREIGRRRTAQETLHESEIKYRHIIDNANSVIMELDTGGTITFINKFARDFFGFSENEIMGHNIAGTIMEAMPSDNGDRQMMIADIVRSPEKYTHYVQENLRKNGDKVSIIWTYKPIFDEENNLKEILCIGIDNTQQKKAAELAAQQLKEKTAVEERTRLARDLHDAVSQTLFSTSLIAEVLPKVWERNQEEGLKKLEEIRQLTRGSLAEMRTLLFELRPTVLADADMNDLLRQLTESVIGKARVQVSLDVDGVSEMPPEVKVAFYRIAQEALNNIAKHSGASRAQVSLQNQPHHFTLQIIDNGRGFDTSRLSSGSFGLNNMRERAGNIGASLQIESKINQGTEITVDWHENDEEVLQ